MCVIPFPFRYSLSSCVLFLFPFVIPFLHVRYSFSLSLFPFFMCVIPFPFRYFCPLLLFPLSLLSFPRRRESRTQVYFITSYHFFTKKYVKIKISCFLFFTFRIFHYWIPAFAGMTEEKAGMTEEKAGMTEEKAGMTSEDRGMA